ncbi:MAG: hypothetical protein EXR99_07385 [Gemmataceae bacterium]|nr:hypothetical protein [Gemmataceae bacterium]
MPAPKKKVAAIGTVYHRHSHCDVILGKILEGFNYDGKAGPNMELASLYIDQINKNDMSRDLAKRYGFRLANSMADALTLGTGKLAVDGVICVGEHGAYPDNAKGQKLYPRRRFFEAVDQVFTASKKGVPLFNDKHLGPQWEDAKWMYDMARRHHVPFLAGSSLPVTWRKPHLDIPKGTPLKEAVQIGYGPFEGYGFHALESLQCLVENRQGGETGVKAVRSLSGNAMWEAWDAEKWPNDLLEAALARVPAHANGELRKVSAATKDAGIFFIEYTDGFRAAMVMPNGWIHEGDGGGFCFATKLPGKTPIACQFYLQNTDPFGHFAELVKAIDHLVNTMHEPYPPERTLLTSGILDAAMTSRFQNGKRVETPHLNIRYEGSTWAYPKGAVPPTVKR